MEGNGRENKKKCWQLFLLSPTIEEPTTTQNILSTAGYAGLEPELDAGTEHEICNIEEKSGARYSMLIFASLNFQRDQPILKFT
jgi:hypothetical protein